MNDTSLMWFLVLDFGWKSAANNWWKVLAEKSSFCKLMQWNIESMTTT
jgi:hypothetical protein